MAACFVSTHSIMGTPHFSGDAVHGARNRNAPALTSCKTLCEFLLIITIESVRGGHVNEVGNKRIFT